MAARAMQFQASTSLAGTLAAYEERRRSLHVLNERRKSSVSANHQELIPQPVLSDIYQRSLPSLHFLRWRPLYHVQAPSGWMNDPAGPGYDASTGLYHLFFQWNPKRNISGSVAWGSICWGHASSRDLVSWSVDGKAAIKPGAWYDKEGCFTGCLVPSGLDGTEGLTLFYTGVSRLPLHYTLPYKNGTETLAVAQLTQNGDWVKMRGNPLLAEPPTGLNVTGFRDPFVAHWPAADRILGEQEGSMLYGLISGGVRDKSPTGFLYAVNPKRLTEWIYLDAIIDLGLNHTISRWSGDMGINWECLNFMTLTSVVDGSSREFFIVGGEGTDSSHPNSTFAEHPQLKTTFPRNERSLQWMSGHLVAGNLKDGRSMPRMQYLSGGRFDHALMYGVNSFYDPTSKKQVAYGWITEEDLPQKLVDRQNWSGLTSLPRELSLVCIKDVVGALRSPLRNITSFELEEQSEDAVTVRTLGISPHTNLEKLRQGAKVHELVSRVPLRETPHVGLDVQTLRFELAAVFEIADACRMVGIDIYHSQEQISKEATTISMHVDDETMVVDRPESSQIDPEIHTFSERAPFTLLNVKQRDGRVQREALQIRAYFDESVLEVFINDRCTFATRIYPATKRCWGVKFWAADTSGQTHLLKAKAWDGLRADISVA